MSSIFHYTDAAGLLGILSSQSLFATHYKYLNDLTEAAVIRELIMPILDSEAAEIFPQLVEKGWLSKKYYDVFGTGVHHLAAEKLYGSFVRAIDNVSPFFVTSLCRHDEETQAYEHGLLSQWRAYANTIGFAIEFDEQQLDSLLSLETASHAYAGFKSADVHYDKYDENFEPRLYEGLAGEMIWQVFEHDGVDISSVTGHFDIDNLVIEFAKSAPFFKHQSFSEEREYRIAAVCLRAGKVPDGGKRPSKTNQPPCKGRTNHPLHSTVCRSGQVSPGYIRHYWTAPVSGQTGRSTENSARNPKVGLQHSTIWHTLPGVAIIITLVVWVTWDAQEQSNS
jgi:hypothetical protein